MSICPRNNHSSRFLQGILWRPFLNFSVFLPLWQCLPFVLFLLLLCLQSSSLSELEVLVSSELDTVDSEEPESASTSPSPSVPVLSCSTVELTTLLFLINVFFRFLKFFLIYWINSNCKSPTLSLWLIFLTCHGPCHCHDFQGFYHWNLSPLFDCGPLKCWCLAFLDSVAEFSLP